MRRPSALAVLMLAGCSSAPSVLRGTLHYGGAVPKRPPISAKVVPGAPEEGIARDDFVVDDRGGVRWAFVYVSKGLEGRTFAPPALPAVMEQNGLIYRPHVLGLQAGQELEFFNRDTLVIHSPHIVSSLRMPENSPQVMQAGERRRARFTKPEIMVKLKCDVLPWMIAWLGVVDHPYFGVTDASEAFEIRDLPQGRYTLSVWHEKLQADDRVIDVGADVNADFECRLK
ncbi:MAG: hypothetical protein HY293_07795 [Planctomycetes bacterium]|nr:hypothetical protein [Planctomycetota bacterium]